MLCSQCNTNVPDGSSFCENCGAPLAAQVQPQPQAEPQPQQPQAEPAGQQAYQQPQAEAAGQQAYQQQPGYQQQQPYQQAYQQPGYQQPYQQPYAQPAGAIPMGAKSKVAAGLLGIFLGWLGIHKFYLGYTKAGVIMMLVSLLGSIVTFGFAALAMSIIGLIEGIMYLVKSDWEFYQTYEVGEKQWF